MVSFKSNTRYLLIAIIDARRKLIVAHEAMKTCGVGAEVVALVQERAFDHLDAPIQRVATPDVIIPVNRSLERLMLPQGETIVEAVRSIV
ncbi:MAG TPA: transketolase C-terminal domain-containing protein [Dehalococcoidales bacterium]|nr:transketolase C-terminal domain-containing protein [Dehalococcoidales bacterium]